MTEVCSCVTTVLIIIIIVCVDIEKKSIMASLFEYEKEAIRIKVKALVSDAFFHSVFIFL